MRYSIHHRTLYRYEENVSVSHHTARLTPSRSSIQPVVTSDIRVHPEPDLYNTHIDYFGNQTTFFSLTTPHRELEIESFSDVTLAPARPIDLDLSPPWESIRDRLKSAPSPREIAAGEFTFASPLCPTVPALRDYASESFAPGRPVLEATTELTRRIFQDFSFDGSATTVSTPVSVVFEKRAGVCQDFAHLQISCLRSLGLAAKYVSGYIRTEPPPGKPRLTGADASHAWVALFVPQLGWAEFDATNNAVPGADHIRVAHGRDYHDICPVRGTVYGGGSQTLEIGVTVTPIEQAATSAPLP